MLAVSVSCRTRHRRQAAEVKLPLESIWKIADSKHGLARVAETVCTAIGNATLPSLLEGLSGKEGDLQEAEPD